MAAVAGSADRVAALGSLDVATLVIHGKDDALIPFAAGLRTAELVPHADLLLLADMGHDLPQPLWPLLTNAILGHLRRAETAAG